MLWDNDGAFNRSSPHNLLGGPARAEMLHQPIIDEDGVVYAGFNRTLMAFDKDTGRPVWSWPNKAYTVKNEIVGSPAKCGNLILLPVDGGYLHAVNAGTGKQYWRKMFFNGLTSPICDDNKAWIGSSMGVHAIKLITGKQGVAPALWWTAYIGKVRGPPALSMTGDIFAVSAQTPITPVACSRSTIPVPKLTQNVLFRLSATPGVNAKGNCQWAHILPGVVGTGGPVVTNETDSIGTVLVSNGYGVTSLHTSTGGRQCQFNGPGALVRHAPAIAKSGFFPQQAIVAADDNLVYSFSYKLCTTTWRTSTANYVYGGRAPAIDGAGTIYVGAANKVVALNGHLGTRAWHATTGAQYSAAAMDAAGGLYFVYSGGAATGVQAFALSDARVASVYQRAMRFLLAGDGGKLVPANKLKAMAMLESLCNLQPQIAGGRRNVSPTSATAKGVANACQAANNLANGLDPYGHAKNYVNPLSYTEYSSLLDKQLTYIGQLETNVKEYAANISHYAEQKVLANQAHDLLQVSEEQWQTQINTQLAMLGAYGQQVLKVRGQMLADIVYLNVTVQGWYALVDAEIGLLEKAVAALDADATQQYYTLIAVKDWAGSLNFFTGLGAVFSGKVKRQIAKAKKALEKAAKDIVGIVAFKLIEAGIQQMAKEMDQLRNYTATLQALNHEISTSNASLPKILPAIYADKIAQSRVAWMQQQFKETIEAQPLVGKEITKTLNDYTYLSSLHLDLVLKWFQAAMKLQNMQSALDMVKLRDNVVQDNIASENSLIAGLAQAKDLLEEQRRQQTLLALQTPVRLFICRTFFFFLID